MAQRQRAPRLEQRRERVEGVDDVLPYMLVAVDCARNSRENWPSSRSTVKISTFHAGRQNIYSKTANHNTAISMRGNGGIRTRNENFCHELINNAVRIVIVMINL